MLQAEGNLLTSSSCSFKILTMIETCICFQMTFTDINAFEPHKNTKKQQRCQIQLFSFLGDSQIVKRVA